MKINRGSNVFYWQSPLRFLKSFDDVTLLLPLSSAFGRCTESQRIPWELRICLLQSLVEQFMLIKEILSAMLNHCLLWNFIPIWKLYSFTDNQKYNQHPRSGTCSTPMSLPILSKECLRFEFWVTETNFFRNDSNFLCNTSFTCAVAPRDTLRKRVEPRCASAHLIWNP